MSCCGSVYELDSDTGKRIARGEALEIMTSNLTLVQRETRQNDWQEQRREPGAVKQCRACGYQTTEDFEYCPRCGTKF